MMNIITSYTSNDSAINGFTRAGKIAYQGKQLSPPRAVRFAYQGKQLSPPRAVNLAYVNKNFL